MSGRDDNHYRLGSISVNSVQVNLEALADSDCQDIFEFWNTLRGDRIAPSWKEFDLSVLPANCIRYTHVVDICRNPFDVRFRFWGTGLTDVLHFDRTGQSLLTTQMGYLDKYRREQVLADYRKVIELKTPMFFLWDASSTREHANRMIVPSIRLPLSDDNIHVTNVVTHFDFASLKKSEWGKMFDVHH